MAPVAIMLTHGKEITSRSVKQALCLKMAYGKAKEGSHPKPDPPHSLKEIINNPIFT